jgi:GT2 family glycosyltransferase
LAWKAGADFSRSDLLVFSEADTIVPVHWLSTIYRLMGENPQAVGLVGTYSFQGSSRLANALTRIGVGLTDRLHKAWKGTVAFRGKNFAVRKPLLHACGGFNEFVEAYGDVELSLRAKNFGEILYVPQLSVETANRNLNGLGNSLRYLRRFLISIYLIEVAGRPQALQISKLLPQYSKAEEGTAVPGPDPLESHAGQAGVLGENRYNPPPS